MKGGARRFGTSPGHPSREARHKKGVQNKCRRNQRAVHQARPAGGLGSHRGRLFVERSKCRAVWAWPLAAMRLPAVQRAYRFRPLG